MTSKTQTQTARVLAWLQEGRPLDRVKAWNTLGVIEAPARISELKARGHTIVTTTKTIKNRFDEEIRVAEWRLTK